MVQSWAHKESDMTEQLNNNFLRTRQWKITKPLHEPSHLGWDSLFKVVIQVSLGKACPKVLKMSENSVPAMTQKATS